MNELVGKMLDQKYRIDEHTYTGGMGVIYKAYDVRHERHVAVKVIYPSLASDVTSRARFDREAQIIAGFDHDGIVRMYDYGEDLDRLYIVMEFVNGPTLQDKIRRLASEGQAMPLEEGLHIVRQVAQALHHAHQSNILHRDVKPANIILQPTSPVNSEPDSRSCRPVLIDFGLAKPAGDTSITQVGFSVGTPEYMSPEQCRGEKPDHHSDIYSLGIVLYELVTGHRPFSGSSTEIKRHHIHTPPPSPRDTNAGLPLEVEDIIMHALQKEPQDRFSSAREMADALDHTIGGKDDRDHLPTEPESNKEQDDLAVTEVEPQDNPSYGKLIIESPDGMKRPYSFLQNPTLTVGRAKDNDIVLADDPKITRHHAQVEFDGMYFKVTDLDSTNGAFLDDSRLKPNVPTLWSPRERLRIGSHHLFCEVEGDSGITAVEPGSDSSEASGADYGFSLELHPPEQSGPDKVTYEVQIDNQRNADLTLQLDAKDPGDECEFIFEVSEITVPAGQVRVVQMDVQSKNSQYARTHSFTVAAWPVDAPKQIRHVDGKWEQTSPLKPGVHPRQKPDQLARFFKYATVSCITILVVGAVIILILLLIINSL